MNSSDSTFGTRLKGFRKDAGLSQQGLAQKAGLSIGTVSSLEQDAYDPSWPTVQKLAEALGLDCTAFANTPAVPKKPKKGKK